MTPRTILRSFFNAQKKEWSSSFDWIDMEWGCPTCGDGGPEVNWGELEKAIDKFCAEFEKPHRR